MEGLRFQPNHLHLLVTDLDAFLIPPAVEDAANGEACLRPRRANQVHDGRVRQQRTSAPVLTDEREHPVLDLVPLARSRRQMTHMDCQTGFVGKTLQLPLPQSHP